ncbi:MAG: ABC transporter substrate-binding protein [Candidatus Absconditabacterales bacterium]
MSLIKTKIISFWQRAKSAGLFLNFLRKTKLNQEEIDKRLVYALSPRKIPTNDQLKHLNKFLSPRESLVVRICFLIILVNVIYLGVVFVKKHLQYLPVAGGEYIEGAVGYPKTINPLYAVNRGVDSDLSRLIYSSLLQYNQNGRLENDLVNSIDISADNKEYLVKIKNNVKWHNGDKLSVDDVLFTFDIIKNSDYRSPLRFSFTGVEAEKIDDYTIKFTLSDPYAPFPELLTFGILPKNIWENINPGTATLSDLNLKPIGSGPYKFKSLIKNKDGDLKEYRLTVNSDYYGQAPYIKNISFDFFVSYQEAIKAFNDNQISGLSYLPFDWRKELLAKDSLKFHELVQPQIIALFFNRDKNKTLADKDVRVALATALDKEKIISEVFGGIYPRVDGPILKENFAYTDTIQKYNYAPDSAAATIKTKPLTAVLTVIDSGSNVIVAEKIKTYWASAGVNITLKVISSEQASEVIKNRDFEIILYGEAVGGDPDVYSFWHSSQIGNKGLNLAGYNNPAVDSLLVEARVTTNSDSRIAAYKKFQELVTADLPAIFLYSPTYTYVQNNNLKGFSSSVIIEPADRFSGVSGWYLKTKKKLTW